MGRHLSAHVAFIASRKPCRSSKTHRLASNRSRATGEPFPADWRPSLCVSQIHFQSSTWCGRTGAPLAPIKRSSPSKKAPVVLVPQNTTESLAWLKQASSGASCLHSFKLISVPAHCKAFAATGEPLAPQKLAPATQHQTQSQSVGKPRWPPDCSGHIPYHIHLPPFPSPASQHGRPRQEQQQASRQHQQRLDKKPAQTILKACISFIQIIPCQNGAPEGPRAEGGNRSETKNPAPYPSC